MPPMPEDPATPHRAVWRQRRWWLVATLLLALVAAAAMHWRPLEVDALRRATLVSAGLLATLPFARSVLAQAAAASSQPPGLPVAAVRNVRETFFGTPVDDPYRYFEEPMAPEVAAWTSAPP